MTGTDVNAGDKAERALADLAEQVRTSYPGAAFVVVGRPEEGLREYLEAVLDGAGTRLDGLGSCEDEYVLYDLVDPVSEQLAVLRHMGSDEPEISDFPGKMALRLPDPIGAQPVDPRALMVNAAATERLVNEATRLLRAGWQRAGGLRMDLPVDDPTFPLHLVVLDADGETIAEARQISRLLDHLDPFSDTADSATEALGLLIRAHVALNGAQLTGLARQFWSYQCEDAPAEARYDRPAHRVTFSLLPYVFHVRRAEY
jgi:hypothetical protein